MWCRLQVVELLEENLALNAQFFSSVAGVTVYSESGEASAASCVGAAGMLEWEQPVRLEDPQRPSCLRS